jgi:hypothetical protein
MTLLLAVAVLAQVLLVIQMELLALIPHLRG